MSTTITQELKIENQELLRQYQQFPSHQLRNQLVKLNVGLVRKEVYLWLLYILEVLNHFDRLQQ